MQAKSAQILASFTHFEPDLKAELVQKGRVIEFETGERILQSGEKYFGNLLVLEGLVKVFRKAEDGREFFLFFIEPGEAIYLSVLNTDNINKSELVAVAAQPTKALSIPYSVMDDLILRFKTWYKFVATSYRSRFEKIFTSLDYYAFRGLDDRITDYLRKQTRIFKTKDLRVSHQEIADDLNSSREVISRHLKKMEKNGSIKLKRNRIEVLELDEEEKKIEI
jgi:CRP/FNR family transcriptional regulator